MVTAGVKVNPHRISHTLANHLMNAGCWVTFIQRIMGHKRLNSTMIYARVHDEVVAEDYFQAINRAEKNLSFNTPNSEVRISLITTEWYELSAFVKTLIVASQTLPTIRKLSDRVSRLLMIKNNHE